ncbi:MATE family efflux transporter [Metamycoplasma neophronis]|uniref:MATE family efflux transporter n=1 Tax=Metamycoplasma neophronis TaxID=872983 RepID=A0ABY2Z5X9_9BACT|nr:MATE family efflux transporter [Metamycoplasma neophronis]TPR54699.1 MATE family efflux transporter [Metamycoplasma neophronis]
MKTIKTAKPNVIKSLFPQSKHDWKLYFIKTMPIIIGEILFCLNGFLDNFMVSHLDGGIDALTYANTYTGIIYTVFFAIQGIAAMFVGQYYGRKDYDKVNQIMNLRIWMYLIIVIGFAIPAWTATGQMINLVGGSNIKESTRIEAMNYLILITISWMITSFNFNTNMQLNETGHSNLAFISACLTLATNATINAVFLYGFKKPAHYAAIGSIIGACVCLTSDELLTWYKDRPIFVNLFKLFHITKPIAKQILKRIPAMLVTIVGMITIPLRMMIWARAYPDNMITGSGIGYKWMGINAVTILGLVESLSSIASAVTSVCSSNVSYFVATKLGENNFEEAAKHSQALKGFHTLAGLIMSILMIGVVFGIAYSPATAKGSELGVEKLLYTKTDVQNVISILNAKPFENAGLANYVREYGIPSVGQNIKYDNFVQTAMQMTKAQFKHTFLLCCFTFIAFNPVWCWFYTSAALPRAGGRNMIASITMLSAQWLSFIWLIIITFAIVGPLRGTSHQMPIELAYFLFYSIDILRWAIFEIVAWKTDWKRNVTTEVDGPIMPAMASKRSLKKQKFINEIKPLN